MSLSTREEAQKQGGHTYESATGVDTATRGFRDPQAVLKMCVREGVADRRRGRDGGAYLPRLVIGGAVNNFDQCGLSAARVRELGTLVMPAKGRARTSERAARLPPPPSGP